MTILQSLAQQYQRMAEKGQAPGFGFSSEKISFCLEINADGAPAELIDLRGDDKKRSPRIMEVPSPVKRTVGVAANFLWDKTAYSLGVIAIEDTVDGKKQRLPGQNKRTAGEHAAFVARCREAFGQSDDPGLKALMLFLDSWRPERLPDIRGYTPDMLDLNIVFRLQGERCFVHERQAARAAIAAQEGSDAAAAQCMVTGRNAAPARLHPNIKGIAGGQTQGSSLVSFNADAFTSYNKSQGANAPVSEQAAFAYGAALNAMLARGSGASTRIGDATVAFWAEIGAGGEPAAAAAEDYMMMAFDPAKEEAGKLVAALDAMRAGRPMPDAPEFLDETRVHILGLSPNAGRIAVRFWHSGAFGDFARNMLAHWDDLRLDPPAWRIPPAVWMLLYEIAAQRKAENIPPQLGGALMRSILNGGAYPRPLLSAAITRLRAGDPINGPRTAIIKACLVRDGRAPHERKDDLVSLNRDSNSAAYRLGRLFAVLESAQRAALGKVNATIRDRFFASASATPAGVFPVLLRNSTHHLATLRKGDGGGLGHWLEREIAEIFDGMDDHMPASLSIEDQGRFVIGYYHQRYAKRADKPAPLAEHDTSPDSGDAEGDDA